MRHLIKQNQWIFLLPSVIAFPKLRDFQALLRVHSMCHNEVAPLLYGSNEFYFHDLQEGFDWLDQIGPRNTSMIRELNLCIRDFGNVRAMKDCFHRVLQPMTDLRTLYLWHIDHICANCTSTPCIAFLRRARYIARHGPWLTRTYLDNILPRSKDGESDAEPDKNVSVSLVMLVLSLEWLTSHRKRSSTWRPSGTSSGPRKRDYGTLSGVQSENVARSSFREGHSVKS